jgi:hypothetical protein
LNAAAAAAATTHTSHVTAAAYVYMEGKAAEEAVRRSK